MPTLPELFLDAATDWGLAEARRHERPEPTPPEPRTPKEPEMPTVDTDRPAYDAAPVPAAPNGAAATIGRAVVSIETVRVGAKQMTKAVYNQLPEVPFAALGDVWGSVNVCPADCAHPAADRFDDGVCDAAGFWYPRSAAVDEEEYFYLHGREPIPYAPHHRHYLGTVVERGHSEAARAAAETSAVDPDRSRVVLCRAVARFYWFRSEEGNIDHSLLEGFAVTRLDTLLTPQLFIAV